MSEEMPKSPFRDREQYEKTPLAEEMKAVLGMYELTRRLRAKNPDDPKDVDKAPEDIEESVGDHIAMTAYLMHYFLPLLEEQGVTLDYERVSDMILAHDIGHISNMSPVPAIQRTPEQKREEIVGTAKIFGELPRRDGFNRALFDAYAEYIGQETPEARFVNALNGLETMLYVLSRPPQLRKELVAGRGYALEDYRERIAPFCREFPPIREFYDRAERLFHRENYFAPSRVYENNVTRPDTMKNIFIQNGPEFGDLDNIDVNEENDRLLRLQRLKRKLRFGQAPKPHDEHHDTVAEHTSALLFIKRYFLSSTANEVAQEQKQARVRRPRKSTQLDSRELNEIILAHDAPEALTSDVITLSKTEARAVEEWDAGGDVEFDYAPRAARFNSKFGDRLEGYELDRTMPPFVGSAWFVKGLDMLEAQLYIFDRETRGKLSHMHVMSRDDVHKKAEPILQLFPTLEEHFDALEQKFREEGLP